MKQYEVEEESDRSVEYCFEREVKRAVLLIENDVVKLQRLRLALLASEKKDISINEAGRVEFA